MKGKAGSTTYAAIADSIITTTKEKTDKEISHDTTNALNTLSEIFDKKKIEEKQEYVNILSQVGYRLIGDIAGHKENELNKKAEKARKENNSILAEKYEREAKKWSESGTNRIVRCLWSVILFWRGNWIYDIVDFRTCFLSFGTLLGNILLACGKAG